MRANKTALGALLVIGSLLLPYPGTAAQAQTPDPPVVTAASNTDASQGKVISVLTKDKQGKLHVVKHVASSAKTARSFASQESHTAGVVAASVDTKVSSLTMANDTLRPMQWDMDTLQIETAWAQSTGTGVTVAVVDTGVDATHPDLQGQVLTGTDFVNVGGNGQNDDNGHGSHVAGTIAALSNNNLGVTSMAPGAKILPVKVLDSTGSGWDSNIASGIIWATDHGAQVINLSLGGPTATSVSQNAVAYAISHGVVVVAAAGNSGQSGDPVLYPAAYPGVIAVAATDSNNSAPAWSESGSQVTVAAPGVAISSTTGGGYGYMSGTSMASPHVAALAALLKSKFPSMTVSDLTTRITSTATDLGAVGRDNVYGAGLINPVAALSAPYTPGSTTTTTAPPSTTTTSTTLAPPTTVTIPVPTTVPNTPPALPSPSGAWLTAGDGGVFSFGGAAFYGSTGAIHLNQPIVGMSTSGTGSGYRFVASDGGIFSYGDANFYGSMGGKSLNQPVVGMASTPSGKGYWLVARDGGIFSFGDAAFYGSTGAIHLNKPIVGMTSTPSGRGYWMVASDGGIFAFGDANFYGSLGSVALSAPVVGMTSSASGAGYLMATGDGRVYAFGDASWQGDSYSLHGAATVGVSATPSGHGYILAGADGSVQSYGDATSLVPSSAGIHLNRPVVGASLAAR